MIKYRRGKKECKDIDILVQGKNLIKMGLMEKLGIKEVRWSGESKLSFYFSGVAVDIKAVEKKSWGAGLLHHTGSAKFNLICRMKAKRKGYLLNEYGLWTRGEKRRRVCSAETEKKILEILWADKPYKVEKYLNPCEREF